MRNRAVIYGTARSAVADRALIVERRGRGEPFRRLRLAALGAGRWGTAGDKIHRHADVPALRIAVNGELEGLASLSTRPSIFYSRGPPVVISFHSLEDRIVKRLRRSRGSANATADARRLYVRRTQSGRDLTSGPSPRGGVEDNPRARSAKLRACSKL